MHAASIVILTVLAVLMAGWGSLALWIKLANTRVLAGALVVLWLVLAGVFIAALFGVLWPALKLTGFAGFPAASALLLAWWIRMKPSNDRQWIAPVARQTQGRIQGDILTLENVRNFDWRSEQDYAAHWDTRDYHLSRLQSVDLVLSYWGRPAIAHAMASFGFSDGQFVTFSVEIRRKKGDKFSEIGGFFRMYELSIVAADERDILRVRTNIRGEDGYLYRVQMPPGATSSLLRAYVDEANGLVKRPRFYNTLTGNCTTLVYQMMTRIVPGLPLNYRLLASGYLPEYLYSIDALEGADSIAEYRGMGRFTDRARAVTDIDCFSHEIRRGVPGIR